MPHILVNSKWRTLSLGSLGLLLVLLAACGGAASSGMASTAGGSVPTNAHVPASSSQQSNSSNAGSAVNQYLIKTLKVSMSVKDTRQAADEIQTWVGTTDPHSSSAGVDYEQAGNNLYNITLSFSVEANLYPQIERYLRDYASPHGGQLLSHAQALGDIISIQDKLTDVEGQIENIEAHLKALNDQVTFYPVTVTLQPVDTAMAPADSGWSVGQVFHDALAASLGLAQALVTFVIWLLAFSMYIIPAAFLIWLWVRWRARSQTVMRPRSAPVSIPEPSPEPPPPATPVAP